MFVRTALVCLWQMGLFAAEPVPAALETAISRTMHQIEQRGDFFAANNPRQRMGARFHGSHTDFTHRGGRFSMRLEGHSLSAPPRVAGNRIDIPHGDVMEWFVNDTAGIEHGFTVARRLSTGPLRIDLRVSGDYQPVAEGSGVVLRTKTGEELRYGGLASWDAAGRMLPSRAEVDGDRIRLVVDDAAAQYPVTVDPIFEEPPMRVGSAQAGDKVGYAVAVSGDTAVVGAPTIQNEIGTVYIYVRQGSGWVLQDVVAGYLHYGSSVAISGDTVVIGSPYEESPTYPGAAYVWVRTGTTWTQQARLVASDRAVGDEFGWSVAIDGDTVIVGARAKKAAYAFVRSGGVWTQQGKLTPPPADTSVANFGMSVSIAGDTAVCGGALYFDNGLPYRGVAEVWVRTGTLWALQQRIFSPDQLTDNNSKISFGTAVALHGNTLLVGAPLSSPTGAAYVFTSSGGTWTHQTKLTASDGLGGSQFGAAVGIRGDHTVIGAPGMNGGIGAAYLFSRVGTGWVERRLQLSIPLTSVAGFGTSVAIGGSYALVGAPTGNSNKGETYSFRMHNVRLNSNPAGRTFSMTGSGCPANGQRSAPYEGFFTSCTVQWDTPVDSGNGTRHSFQAWGDTFNGNARNFVFPSDLGQPASTFTGNFVTEHQLTTQAIPSSGGTVSGAGWYTAGSTAGVAAIPNAGFVFTGFTGGLTGVVTPRVIVMNEPKAITGNFTTTPPAVLSGIVTGKSGPSNARQWNIALTNNGPGIAYNAQLFLLMFAQTFGTACTAPPVRLSPAVLPASLGTQSPGSGAAVPVTLDFSGCPANARFTVSLGYMSNGGASGGVISLVNQFQ